MIDFINFTIYKEDDFYRIENPCYTTDEYIGLFPASNILSLSGLNMDTSQNIILIDS